MFLNILMTTDHLPGVVLKSVQRGALVNKEATSFPPEQDATNSLLETVDVEDSRQPGKIPTT